MKKLFFFRGAMVIVTSIASCSLIILLAYGLGPRSFTKWLPNALSNSGGTGYTLLRLKEAKEASAVDMLFIGSSHVHRGFDVRIFQANGMKTFNLGTDGQTLFNSYYLLREHLPALRPKHVVLDLYWSVAKNNGVEPTIDILSNSAINENALEMALNLKNGTVFGSLAANLILRLRTPVHQIRQKEFKDTRYVSGGFTESLSTRNELFIKELENMEQMEANLNDLQLEYLGKIISLCKSSNTKMIFVMTPVTQEYKNKVVNYNSYSDKIAEIAKMHSIPYFDYNQRQDLRLVSSYDFSDKNHLDQSGAEKFDALFIKDLQSLGISDYSLSQR